MHISLFKHQLGPFNPAYSHLRLISVKRPDAEHAEWYRYSALESPSNARLVFDDYTGDGEPEGWNYASKGSRIRHPDGTEAVTKRWGTEMVSESELEEEQAASTKRGKLKRGKASVAPADGAQAAEVGESAELAQPVGEDVESALAESVPDLGAAE